MRQLWQHSEPRQHIQGEKHGLLHKSCGQAHEEAIKDWPHMLTVEGRKVWQAVGNA